MSCPICKKESDPKLRPFCSRRCADVDLGRWLSGTYTLAADSQEDLEEAAKALADKPSGPH